MAHGSAGEGVDENITSSHRDFRVTKLGLSAVRLYFKSFITAHTSKLAIRTLITLVLIGTEIHIRSLTYLPISFHFLS